MSTTYWLKFGNTPLGYNGNALKTEYIPSGTIAVSMEISGENFDPNKKFTVTVTFGEPIRYKVDGVLIPSPSDTYSVALASGQSVALSAIPEGTTYSISTALPSDAEYYSGYSRVSGTSTGTMGDGVLVTYAAEYSFVERVSSFTFKYLSVGSVGAADEYTASFFEEDGVTPASVILTDDRSTRRTSATVDLSTVDTKGFSIVMEGRPLVVSVTRRLSLDLYVFDGTSLGAALVAGPLTSAAFRITLDGHQYWETTRLSYGAGVCNEDHWYL